MAKIQVKMIRWGRSVVLRKEPWAEKKKKLKKVGMLKSDAENVELVRTLCSRMCTLKEKKDEWQKG